MAGPWLNRPAPACITSQEELFNSNASLIAPCKAQDYTCLCAQTNATAKTPYVDWFLDNACQNCDVGQMMPPTPVYYLAMRCPSQAMQYRGRFACPAGTKGSVGIPVAAAGGENATDTSSSAVLKSSPTISPQTTSSEIRGTVATEIAATSAFTPIPQITQSHSSISAPAGHATLSTGAKAGIGAAVTIGGVLLLGIVAFFFFYFGRRSASKVKNEEMVEEGSRGSNDEFLTVNHWENMYGLGKSAELDGVFIAEIDGETKYELEERKNVASELA